MKPGSTPSWGAIQYPRRWSGNFPSKLVVAGSNPAGGANMKNLSIELEQIKAHAQRITAARKTNVVDVREAFGFMPVDVQWVVIHQADGAYLEVLSFHKNEAIARKNLREIEDRKAENFMMTIELDNGSTIERTCSWDGYFESLDYARCESFVVSGGGA